MCRWIGGYGHAAVPTHFYKILLRCNDSSIIDIPDCPIDNLETLTFLFEHSNSSVPKVAYFYAILLVFKNITVISCICWEFTATYVCI